MGWMDGWRKHKAFRTCQLLAALQKNHHDSDQIHVMYPRLRIINQQPGSCFKGVGVDELNTMGWKTRQQSMIIDTVINMKDMCCIAQTD